MNNMDDQYREMGYFREALINFNTRLKSSMQEMEQHHEAVSPHWQDEMRRHYDAQWQPLHDVMGNYIMREGPNYVEFLSIKLYALERYLRGG
ncbi:MAG: hypothetical protein H0T73_04390 [Ardenticatenales bacterium]|nr:hypothetical protein [Ardenticatenales bacterium]